MSALLRLSLDISFRHPIMLTRLRQAIRRWLVGRPDHPTFIDLRELGGERRLREIEYQQRLDAESMIVRTSRQCRAMPRRVVAGLIERVRGRL